MDDDLIAQILDEKGLDAPRLNPDVVRGQVVEQMYYQFPGTVHTVCCLRLKNGFTVIGESAPVSPRNFDAEIGRQIAFSDAVNKIWQLEGYLLRQTLHEMEGDE